MGNFFGRSEIIEHNREVSINRSEISECYEGNQEYDGEVSISRPKKRKNIVISDNGISTIKGTNLVVDDSRKIVIGEEKYKEIFPLSRIGISICKKKRFAYVTKEDKTGKLIIPTGKLIPC